MDQQKFLQVFSEILAPDTARVKAATATLKQDFYPKPESLIILLQLLLSDQPSALRQLAATQARSQIPKQWKALTTQDRANYRGRLLQGTLNEKEQIIRHGAARVITAVAKIDYESKEWPNVIDQLLGAATNADPRQREVGTYVLFTSLEAFGEEITSRSNEILAAFSKTIKDPDSAEVRLNTMLAISRLAIVLDVENDEQALAAIQGAVPQMVAVLKSAIDAGEEDRTTQCFEVFQTLLGCDASVLNIYFGDLVQFMIRIASEKDLDEDARTQALSFLMQCVRYRKLKMQALKVGEQLTKMCLEIAVELGDVDDDDDEDVTTPKSALTLLDEMASSLPPVHVVVPLLHAMGPYVNHAEPERRQAATLALGMVVEGAPDFIATQLDDVFPLVLRLLEDPESMVRRAALDTVMRIAEELPEEIAKEHSKLLPSLVKHMDIAVKSLKGPDDKSNLDIIRASCSCIESMVEGLESKDIEPYLSELIPRLTRLFSHPDPRTKAAAIGAAGAVGASAKEAFMPYFGPTMHAWQNYVELKDSPDELDVRSQTIDAMASLALAVGPKAFQPYVRPLMQATDEGLHLDHPKLKETSFLFWGAMAKVYGDDFKPFLDGVVKALFECLETEESDFEVDLGEDAADLAGKEVTIGGKKIKIAALADDDFVGVDDIEDLDEELAKMGDDDSDDDSDDDWDDLDVVSAVAQEKEIAAEVLGDVLTHTAKDYLPYMKQTIECVMPLVDHSYEGVQKAALGTLFRAYVAVWELQPEDIRKWTPGIPVQKQPNEQVKSLGNMIMTATMALWEIDEDRAIITDINRNMGIALRAAGPSFIAEPSMLKKTTEILTSIITKKHPCQRDFGDEEELGELEESSEYDWLTIDTAMDAICGLAGALGGTFGELWQIFEKPIMKFASGSESFERANAVGVISECIRAMGKDITPYTKSILPIMMKRLTDEDSETKSNAAYAVGLLQLHSLDDNLILKQFNTILSRLEPLLQTDKSRQRDNAIGCLSRMILRHPARVPLAQVLPPMLEVLPLKEDFDENEPLYDMIVTLYSKGEPTLVGLTPQLLPVLAEVTSPEPKDQLKEETQDKVVQLVKFIASKHPGEVKKYQALAALL